jgi:hypothetical protein
LVSVRFESSDRPPPLPLLPLPLPLASLFDAALPMRQQCQLALLDPRRGVASAALHCAALLL